MEVIMEYFFDDVFTKLERDYLVARYRRQMLAEYISTVIKGCKDNGGCEKACEVAVISAMKYHDRIAQSNGGVCLLGKHHNVLYVAVKLCYDWTLRGEVVGKLLSSVFSCEGTFERLVVGAVLGVKVSQMVCGWKSDFNNREESLKALDYLAGEANRCRLEFPGGQRLCEVELECCGGASPAWVCIQAGREDALGVLLRRGARIDTTSRHAELLSQSIAQGTPQMSAPTVQLLLRAILTLPPPLDPPDVVALSPPSLKHISKLAVRRALADNFHLPEGILDLPIPVQLKDYVNLETD